MQRKKFLKLRRTLKRAKSSRKRKRKPNLTAKRTRLRGDLTLRKKWIRWTAIMITTLTAIITTKREGTKRRKSESE